MQICMPAHENFLCIPWRMQMLGRSSTSRLFEEASLTASAAPPASPFASDRELFCFVAVMMFSTSCVASASSRARAARALAMATRSEFITMPPFFPRIISVARVTLCGSAFASAPAPDEVVPVLLSLPSMATPSRSCSGKTASPLPFCLLSAGACGSPSLEASAGDFISGAGTLRGTTNLPEVSSCISTDLAARTTALICHCSGN
mmetsp:Transcript_3779/g.5383  ORF Transcript_3779/g.5383 Transcript_3779/m.5383 type:complete len:205 (-) Transcript_3779:1248-1862(-)